MYTVSHLVLGCVSFLSPFKGPLEVHSKLEKEPRFPYKLWHMDIDPTLVSQNKAYQALVMVLLTLASL